MEEKINNTPETFLLFNELAGTIEAINMQYNDKTKSMCNVVVFGCLVKAYSIHEVYERLLSYMQDNNLYERYLSCILELQFNPPKSEEVESDIDAPDGKPDNKQRGNKGGVATKVDDNKSITKVFIENLFKDNEEE